MYQRDRSTRRLIESSKSRLIRTTLLWFFLSTSSFLASRVQAARHTPHRYSSFTRLPKHNTLPPSLSVRGGSQRPSDPSSYYGYNAPPQQGAPIPPDNDDPFHQTEQERVDEWRKYQQEHASADSPRDDQGRLKLLTSVSKGSRALIFFVLMWRDIHLYEVADQSKTGIMRLVFVIPLTLLFIANMAGVVASLTSPSHAAKKRLKAILNLDKLLEVLLIAFYFLRLTIAPSKYTPREMYIANTMHSVFFILQCQAFTRLSWDETSAQPVSSFQQTPQQQKDDGGWYYSRQQQEMDEQRFKYGPQS